ncbi:MAG: zinc ribbon domain-containing protein [Methanobacteriaceae archaeon]|nr:zinc ribbon domain-containing protein [Methanobacteriaceae archaeon]MDP3623861.1 zinc ribbon domain-containing protein [Methanobacteriaceae archaeon]
MAYLVCEDCGGYYELQKGESADSFDKCECGGKLNSIEKIDPKSFMSKNEKSDVKKPDQNFNKGNSNLFKNKETPVENTKKEDDRSQLMNKTSNEIPDESKDYSGTSDETLCSKCGTNNKTNAKFCINCGNDLIKRKICANCGVENPDDARFCQECGKHLPKLPSKSRKQKKIQDDTQKGLSLGEAIVICIFSPIAGTIAYLIWHDNKPGKAKDACLIAILAAVIGLIAYIFISGMAFYLGG